MLGKIAWCSQCPRQAALARCAPWQYTAYAGASCNHRSDARIQRCGNRRHLAIARVAEDNRFLWSQVPAEILRITYYWPMQRFYLIIASLLAAAGQLAFGYLPVLGIRAGRIWVRLLVVGCLWSLWESRQFIRAASDRTASAQVTARSQRPENLFLTNDSYGLFAGLPPDFSNGVVNPRGQAHLLSPGTGERLPSGERRVLVSGTLVGAADENPGVLLLGTRLRVERGRRYMLELQFNKAGLVGILQLAGNSVFREYNLPHSGEALAFGSGPSNAREIELWTSDPAGDDIAIRFIPTAPGETPEDFTRFGSYRLLEVDADREPLEVDSLVPFRARVRADEPAVLETPHMYMPGYRASVDGEPAQVIRTASGLAAVAVPAGAHAATLWFAGPPSLRISYWAAIAAWVAILGLAARGVARALGESRN